MRNPICHIDGNLIFARSTSDIWAIYQVECESYPGLTLSRQIEAMQRLYYFAYRIEAPFWIGRVQRTWSVDDYAVSAQDTVNTKTGHPDLFGEYLAEQYTHLSRHAIYRPELYLAVRLQDLDESLASIVGAGGVSDVLAALGRYFGMAGPRALSRERLARIYDAEARVRRRVLSFLDAWPAATDRVEWLIRRAYTRGLGEPYCDGHTKPRALILPEDAERHYQPDEDHVLRFSDSLIRPRPNHLEIYSELGTSYQTHLVLGATQELRHFPGYDAELMFAPLDTLDFPVDATFSADWIPNRDAIKEAAKRKVDADQMYREESMGDHGPSPEAAERPLLAREHEAEIRGAERVPMLNGNLILSVGAGSLKELRERVDQLRGAYGSISLFRPVGDQVALHVGTLPAQRFPLRDMRERLTLREFACMVPTACNHAGSDVGLYLANTASASRQPFLFSLSEASRASLPPTVILAGTLGSGKTMTLQTMMYQAFLQGSTIVDIDPKGDHHLELLPGVAEQMKVIELRGDERYRGLLDPLRIAERSARFDMALTFLTNLLPDRTRFETTIGEAVKHVIEECDRHDMAPTCSDVLALLEQGGIELSDEKLVQEAREAARALRLYSDTGLGQLGFARPEDDFREVGATQVTSLRIRDLPLPEPNTPREELTNDERVGQAVLKLLAVFAMHLMGSDRTQGRRVHKVLGFDEAWFMLQDTSGQRLIKQLARWGRSELATPILITHLAADASDLDNLVGARFIFRMQSDDEARRALSMLGLDPEDEYRRRQLTSEEFRRGRCLIRDYFGRVIEAQIDPGQRILDALNTTPTDRADDAELVSA